MEHFVSIIIILVVLGGVFYAIRKLRAGKTKSTGSGSGGSKTPKDQLPK